MDRKSIGRFKKVLEARHRELRLGITSTRQEMLAAQHDFGKDEGDRANTSLAREIDLGQKSRDRALLALVDAALKRISGGTQPTGRRWQDQEVGVSLALLRHLATTFSLVSITSTELLPTISLNVP